MKTIFDKIDPAYIDCASGLCEHTSHQFNLVYLLILPLIAISYFAFRKYIKS